MKNEIELRSLITKLELKDQDIQPYSLALQKELNLIPRKFGITKKWSRKEKTSYIESILLQCTLQPIIRFKNYDHTVIIDGFNRYETICEFCNNELKLDPNGLKELKFLANKKFKDLEEIKNPSTGKIEKGISYFKNCDPIKVIDYSYNSQTIENKILTEEEEFEIERYLHILYNTGIRLNIEEIQRAEYHNDLITNLIRNKIEHPNEDSEDNFLNKLEELKLFNGRNKRNKLENILLNCRLLIASTYSNINLFCEEQYKDTRIEKNYLPNICEKNQTDIFNEFVININQIYANLVETQKWLKYKNLHCRPFIEATYWLISIIRKDHLSNPLQFDFIKYIEYFGKKEELENNFDVCKAHYKNNMFNKYLIVAKYYEQEYGVDMSSYFEKGISPKKTPNSIKSFNDLSKRHFNPKHQNIKVRELLYSLQNGKVIIRPFYQRKETMNNILASRVIESLLLGIKLPYILVYRYYKDDDYITEVVDGQQRILAIIAYLQEYFQNENGEKEFSNKNGFALKDLRIMHELNNCKSKSNNKKDKVLSKFNLEKILDSDIDLSIIAESKDSKEFSAVDHFVRLNKNISSIKENSYKMLDLIGDREIILFEKNITKNFIGKILPKDSIEKRANLITLKLASLNYYSHKELVYYNFANQKISNWLKDFNKLKDENAIKNPELVKEKRNEYKENLEVIQAFYEKLNIFLEKNNKTINDLTVTKKGKKISVIAYYYLFFMLKNISQEDLQAKATEIYLIIYNFFKSKEQQHQKNIKILNYATQSISIYDKNLRYNFQENLKMAIENNKIKDN